MNYCISVTMRKIVYTTNINDNVISRHDIHAANVVRSASGQLAALRVCQRASSMLHAKIFFGPDRKQQQKMDKISPSRIYTV